MPHLYAAHRHIVGILLGLAVVAAGFGSSAVLRGQFLDDSHVQLSSTLIIDDGDPVAKRYLREIRMTLGTKSHSVDMQTILCLGGPARVARRDGVGQVSQQARMTYW
jgi:hypothetical protein